MTEFPDKADSADDASLSTAPPKALRVGKDRTEMSMSFSDGRQYELSAEYLRVMSPSAEVRGHGPGQEKLQFGKRHVQISDIRPVGRYAVRISFSDGHDTGIYSWSYLQSLAMEYDTRWAEYERQLQSRGLTRD